MAGLGDMMARAQAAQGMARGGGEMMPPEEAMPGEESDQGVPPVDLESALSGVEAALEEMDPTDAEEARTHVNAIREIAARAEKAAPPEEAAPAEASASAIPGEGTAPIPGA